MVGGRAPLKDGGPEHLRKAISLTRQDANYSEEADSPDPQAHESLRKAGSADPKNV